MSNYRLEIMLHQYTPLLHFQGDEEGACLRASEVKPKLDKFVVEFLNHEGAAIPESWKLTLPNDGDGTVHYSALRYKMRFEAKGEPDEAILNEEIHPLYFGNQGAKNANKVKNVYYPDGISMTIVTLVKEPLQNAVTLPDGTVCKDLLALLHAMLPSFFELHGFGTRSNKGFGCFGVKGEKVSAELLNRFKPNQCHAVLELTSSLDNYKWKQQLNDIYVLSAMMKGGFNRPYFKGKVQTALPAGFQSEKAYVKTRVFTEKEFQKYQNSCKPQNRAPRFSRIQGQYRFVRAMLGLTETYSFRLKKEDGKPIVISVKDSEKAKDKDEQIVRFANPLIFHPSDGRILLQIRNIPEVMFNHGFALNGKLLKTPSTSEFQIIPFVRDFLYVIDQKRFKGEWGKVLGGHMREIAFENTLKHIKVNNWGGINSVN